MAVLATKYQIRSIHQCFHLFTPLYPAIIISSLVIYIRFFAFAFGHHLGKRLRFVPMFGRIFSAIRFFTRAYAVPVPCARADTPQWDRNGIDNNNMSGGCGSLADRKKTTNRKQKQIAACTLADHRMKPKVTGPFSVSDYSMRTTVYMFVFVRPVQAAVRAYVCDCVLFRFGVIGRIVCVDLDDANFNILYSVLYALCRN